MSWKEEGETVLRIETVKVDDYGEVWVQPKQLVKQYSMTRPTIWRLLKKMRALPKYKNAYIDLSPNLKLVRAKDFLEFLHGQNLAYMKE
ncbi:hypothetical protein [Acidaminococcus timonensis]|uniref:hypothetical protein n=1 Tax=Acidaminococcus timonensis TaxID=1871002 RepID=UPI003A5C1EFB